MWLNILLLAYSNLCVFRTKVYLRNDIVEREKVVFRSHYWNNGIEYYAQILERMIFFISQQKTYFNVTCNFIYIPKNSFVNNF